MQPLLSPNQAQTKFISSLKLSFRAKLNGHSHQGENKLVKKNGYMIERHILKVDGLGLLVVKKKRLESYDIELTSELWRF